MSKQYEAFISYRHMPLDSRIAGDIQRKIETYRIPRTLRKELGRKEVGSVFRDKEELPTTSDLNDDIMSALKHSKYLIVICSKSTRESIWVEREIRAFLQNHSRKQVITVLAEGEPYEVIPEILLYEDRKIIDADGYESVQRINYEPLSCDYRVRRRIADRDELPRMVASILNVNYDSLKQRKKTYFLQRLITIVSICLALALGFAIYAFRQSSTIRHQANKLEEEYNRTLRENSLDASSEAQLMLDKNNPIEAARIVMDVLPDQDNDKPIYPEAMAVLGKALGIYQSPVNVEDAMVALRSFELPDRTKSRFVLTDDGRYIIFANNRTIVTLDTDTFEIVNAATIESLHGGTTGIDFDENLIIEENNSVICVTYDYRILSVDYLTGETLWIGSVPLMSSGRIVLSNDKSILAVVTEEEIVLMNSLNGDIIKRTSHNLVGEELSLGNIAISDDNKQMAVAVYSCEGELTRHNIWLVDLNRETFVEACENVVNANRLQFSGDKLLVLSSEGRIENYVTSFTSSILYEGSRIISLYDADKGKIAWETQFDPDVFYSYNNIVETNYLGEDAYVVTSGNMVVLVSQITGEILREYRMPAPIIKTIEINTGLRMQLSDGKFCLAKYELDLDEKWMLMKSYYPDNVCDIAIDGENAYVMIADDNMHSITKYGYEVYDDNFEMKDESVTSGYKSKHFRKLDSKYLFSYGIHDEYCFLYDKEDERIIEIPMKDPNDIRKVLGMTNDNKTLLFLRDDFYKKKIYAYDLHDQIWDVKDLEFPDSFEYNDIAIWQGNVIVFGITGEMKYAEEFDDEYCLRDTFVVYKWDFENENPELLAEYKLGTGKARFFVQNDSSEKMIPVQKDRGLDYYISGSMSISADGNHVVLLYHNPQEDTRISKCILVDLSTGKVNATKDLFSEQMKVDSYRSITAVSGDGSLTAVICKQESGIDIVMSLSDISGKILWSGVCEKFEDKHDITGVRFTNDNQYIFVTYEGRDNWDCNHLIQYDTSDGHKVNEWSESWIYYDLIPIDDNSMLVSGGGGQIVQNFNGVSGITATINHYIGYDDLNDILLVTNGYGSNAPVGGFKRYSDEKLIEMGREFASGL